MSVKFAVLGYGVVGSGVVELFYKNKASIEISLILLTVTSLPRTSTIFSMMTK